jgi:Family of unknown function (DUF6338)
VPTSLNQVLILLVFIIPGFVLVRVKRVAYPSVSASTGDTVLESLAWSCFVHAFALPLWYPGFVSGWWSSHPVVFGLFAFTILLLFPGLLGGLYVRLTKTGRLRGVRELMGFPQPDPTSWDYFFRKERAYWVWLTFKSGKVMAGLFGPNSFASSFPHKRDLYIEKLLRLDDEGKVVELIQNSAGALVTMDDLERIQFFEIGEVEL